MTFQDLLHMVEAGDTAGVDAWTVSGMQETVSGDEKLLLTRAAAKAGQAGMLRHLFERDHLYAADPDDMGRTVLHFAARSGDAGTVRFATDVLGFDPLTGDRNGRTALDEALDAPAADAYRFLTERTGFPLSRGYRNPVLRGFHPDPSVVRVGEDYYLVNSSFVFFPGLPVFHSKDLVHWRLIGHAADNLGTSGLAGLPGGYGYWAPDISFFRDRFWVVATLRRSDPPYRLQMITSAADPRGPWDPPRFLPLDGIDPSLFTDEDGRRYILLNPGAILAEIGSTGELLSEPEMICFGSARIKPEGPHLLKKDGWYYLFLAEGGTGEGHMETVLRSRRLKGPYEACPFNPILGRKNGLSPIQRSGHGKPVSTPDGRWYFIYLCGRKTEGKTVMGRETALDPVTWTADGWPMVNRLKGPSCLQGMPIPGDDTPCVYNTEWIAPRSDLKTYAQFSSGGILLRGGRDPAGTDPCSLLLCRQAEARFRQEVRLSVTGLEEGDFAGVAGYYDERSFFLFGIRKRSDGNRLEVTEQIGEQRKEHILPEPVGTETVLSVGGEGLSRILSAGGKPVLALRTEYLSDEGIAGGKRFTGALAGLYCIGKGTAAFSGFRIRFFPDGAG